ncbi:phosphopantetheine-binding protein [Mycobacteroides abscessus]
MTDTQQDSTPETSLETPAPEVAAPTGGAGLTVPEMREWLRNWIAKATGVSPDRIDDSAPMVEMGLSSRDAVAMAADIEDLTGVTLTATVAFQHPTIESLATRIIEGEPEVPDAGDEDWSRDPKIAAGEFDIAVVGLSARLPGDVNSPAQLWEALLEGRDAITDLPEGRWEEFTAEPRIAERVAQHRHPRWISQGHQGIRRRVLHAVQDGSRQHGSAAADRAGIDLGGTGKRPYSGIQPQG